VSVCHARLCAPARACAHAACQAIAFAKGPLLATIHRQLDGALASFGLHPGRPGLSDVELLAAMKMLG
jgi:hypothetical protein